MTSSHKKRLRKPKSELNPTLTYDCIPANELVSALRHYENTIFNGTIRVNAPSEINGTIHVCIDRISGFLCQLHLISKESLPIELEITPEKFLLRVAVTPIGELLSFDDMRKVLRAAHHSGFRLTRSGNSIVMKTELYGQRMLRVYAQTSSASMLFALSMEKMLEQYNIRK